MQFNKTPMPGSVTMVMLDQDRMRHYQEQARPTTVRRAIRRLTAIARDRDALAAMGDAEAVAGATVMLREAALDAMAVPARDVTENERKLEAIHRYFAIVADPPWLMEAGLGMAVKIEWHLLEITPDEEDRLRKTLPKSRIG